MSAAFIQREELRVREGRSLDGTSLRPRFGSVRIILLFSSVQFLLFVIHPQIQNTKTARDLTRQIPRAHPVDVPQIPRVRLGPITQPAG